MTRCPPSPPDEGTAKGAYGTCPTDDAKSMDHGFISKVAQNDAQRTEGGCLPGDAPGALPLH